MTQNQKDILDMFSREWDYVKNKTAAISGTRPGLITGINKLKTDAIDKINATEAKQQQLLIGYTQNKSAKRNELDVQLYYHVSGTYAWAGLTNNATLQGQMRYTNSDIVRITDETIVNVCDEIIGFITPHIAVVGLNEMGVDAASMLLLTGARDAYHLVESEPVEMIQQRAAFTSEIEEHIKTGRTILETICDPAAATLKVSEREWWKGYQHERHIVSTGHRHTTIEGTLFETNPTDASKLNGFYGGSVTVTHEDGTQYVAKADEVGHFKMVKVKNGIFTSIKYQAPGKKPFELGAFKLKKGHVAHKSVFLAGETEEEGGRAVPN